MKPRLLDLFCCEGGASTGYARAGFDVIGVDLFRHRDSKGRLIGFNQRRYPFPSHQADAIAYAIEHAHRFDAIAASPPCQHASAGTRAMRAQGDDRHPALIEPTREALIASGRPYVIENVSGAALLDPLLLCWSMFNVAGSVTNADGVPLRMERHRLFESNVALTAPRPCEHPASVQVAGSYGAAQRTIEGAKRRHGGYVPERDVQQRLLGIDWMTERGMHQSIPPAYTEHIGRQLLEAIA
jgi:DNA (cytosine-5)-methyltransferase 1